MATFSHTRWYERVPAPSHRPFSVAAWRRGWSRLAVFAVASNIGNGRLEGRERLIGGVLLFLMLAAGIFGEILRYVS
jgi:hypothetical protein